MSETALRTLLAGSIDYAGLFPPAGLPMAEAVRGYAAYRASPDAWALGRFVVPAGRLAELEAEVESLAPTSGVGSPAEPWRLSVLLGADAAGDLERLGELNCRHAGPGATALSGDVVEAKAATVEAIERLLRAVPRWATAYVEVPLEPDPAPLLAAIARAGGRAKARTGGITPDAFPEAPALLRFLRACTAANLAFKLTAGLHHAVRSTTDEGFEQHGLLNVLVATRVAQTGGSVDDVAVPLALRSADPLVGFVQHWDEGTCAGVRAAFRSFGCCGVTDPLGDLAVLGLLEDFS